MNTFLPSDPDAIEIGALYLKAKTSILDSVKFQIECGQRLTKKKSELEHGQWLQWLKDQQDILGFTDRRTASRLMELSNGALAPHITEPAEAIALSRKTWGHTGESRVAVLTGETEWYTPAEYVEASRRVLGEIDLDPASNALAQKVVRARRFYTQDDDGLAQDWNGTVFLNPPYAHPTVEYFVNRLVKEHERGRVPAAVLLTNNATDTGWWHAALNGSDAVCFTRGRISFYQEDGAKNSPTHGQTFFYFGTDVDVFAGEFSEFGSVVAR